MRRSPSALSLVALAVDALATYRLTRLVKDDKVTEDFRNAVYRRYGQPDESKRSYLLQCPWCLSLYFGFLVSLCRNIVPSTWNVAATALALSAITGLMAEHEESSQNVF